MFEIKLIWAGIELHCRSYQLVYFYTHCVHISFDVQSRPLINTQYNTKAPSEGNKSIIKTISTKRRKGSAMTYISFKKLYHIFVLLIVSLNI